MKYPYFQNYFGAELTEDEYQDVKHPYVEMYTHVTLKTVQAGTLFGTLLFGPLIALARKDTRNMKGLVAKVGKAGKVGAGIGLVTGPAMTYSKFRDQTYEQVWDRAYRVRKNRGQVRADQGYIAGGVIGSLVTTLTASNPLVGELVGSSIGILGAAYYTNMYLPKKEKEEKKA